MLTSKMVIAESEAPFSTFNLRSLKYDQATKVYADPKVLEGEPSF